MSMALILISLLSYFTPVFAIHFSDVINRLAATGFVAGIFAGFFSVYLEYFFVYQLKSKKRIANKILFFSGPLLSIPLYLADSGLFLGYLGGYLISFSQSLAIFLLMRRSH